MFRLLFASMSFLMINLVFVRSANILFLSNVPSPSHGLWNFRLMGGLAERGHNVTVLSPNTPKAPIPNLHLISTADLYTEMKEEGSIFSDFVDNNSLEIMKIFHKLLVEFCDIATRLNGFKSLLNYPDDFKFDLVIYDFSCGSCLLGFLHKFNYPPLIGVSAFKYGPEVVEIMGGHHFPAYIPRPSGSFTVNMSLFQRFYNAYGILYEIYQRRFVSSPEIDKILSSHFKGVPSVRELEKRITIALLNTHPATDFPVPLPPNIIEVGGLQIADARPLPKDLQKFLDESIRGTVLISFGTNVHSDIFGEERQNIIVEMARKFPNYNFLWKFEIDIVKGKLPNLMIKPWLPQNDLLAHPKLKAFVTHCGGLSTHEATYHGVPMIAVPFFGDQFTNARESVQAGVAVKVSIGNFSIPPMEAALHQILEDSSFSEKIKLRSLRFRSRPIKPLDKALWWIEYILRDPNPVHLKSPVISLGHFKANCLDLISYFLLFLLALFFGVKFMVLKCISVTVQPQKTLKVKTR